MRVLDLFFGIGGFSLGLERAGMTTMAFCEIEAFPRKVLKKHWPEIPIYDDIKKLKGKQFRGTIDLICGGFPCQPYSQAGKREGFRDDRDLWPEMFRVIQEVRPAWVIGENVVGFISMGLDRTISDLEGAGYGVQTFIIPACAVGAPHQRSRVWIIANTESGNGRRKFGHLDKQDGQKEKRREAASECESTYSCFAEQRNVSNAGKSKRVKGIKQLGASSLLLPKSGSSGWWAVEPGMGRVANGVPARVDRLKGLGNAVVPQMVEVIGRAIMEAEK